MKASQEKLREIEGSETLKNELNKTQGEGEIDDDVASAVAGGYKMEEVDRSKFLTK